MVQVGRSHPNGRVKTCQLHDLMRDLCLTKAKEENFLEINGLWHMATTPTPNMVRRYAIYLDQSVHVADVRIVQKNRDEGANNCINFEPRKWYTSPVSSNILSTNSSCRPLDAEEVLLEELHIIKSVKS